MSFCTQCHIVHGEEHQFCQKCGNPLAANEGVPQLPCTNCRAPIFPGQNFCTECGQPNRSARPGRRGSRPTDKEPLFYPSRTGPGEAPQRRGLSGMWMSVLAIALVLVGTGYFYLRDSSRKKPVKSSPPVETILPPARPDTLQREVERLAEKIRSAHLNKNINQFIACYSPAYPQLGQLEANTLETWKNYDFKNVSYNISNVRSLGVNQASAELVWNFQLYNHQTKTYELQRAAYEVILEGVKDGWKIRESKEMGYS
jgi:hypothetical protein